jgi:hypothetical protein
MLYAANSLHKQHKETKMKKTYNVPKLTVHGNVEALTQKNGVSFTDVPQGTAVGGPGGVTGS